MKEVGVSVLSIYSLYKSWNFKVWITLLICEEKRPIVGQDLDKLIGDKVLFFLMWSLNCIPEIFRNSEFHQITGSIRHLHKSGRPKQILRLT